MLANVTVMRIGRNNPQQEVITSGQRRSNARLSLLAEEWKYKLVQNNGQRLFGPPLTWDDSDILEAPCELFISKIPPHVYEDTFLPLLLNCGGLFQLRTMLKFDGTSRGFAFANFVDKQSAINALFHLAETELSVDFCRAANLRLFVGRISCTCLQLQFMLANILVAVEGITRIDAYYSDITNRHCLVLYFDTHKNTAYGRRTLKAARCTEWFEGINVWWFRYIETSFKIIRTWEHDQLEELKLSDI